MGCARVSSSRRGQPDPPGSPTTLGAGLVRVAGGQHGAWASRERFGRKPPDPVDEQVIVFPWSQREAQASSIRARP